jgi:hypothetical protein
MSEKIRVVSKKFMDVESNDWNHVILNSRGERVTKEYMNRYIQCWCRQGDGFTHNRRDNFKYFMSDEFLSANAGKTASQIGKIASMSDRWIEKKIEKSAKK